MYVSSIINFVTVFLSFAACTLRSTLGCFSEKDGSYWVAVSWYCTVYDTAFGYVGAVAHEKGGLSAVSHDCTHGSCDENAYIMLWEV